MTDFSFKRVWGPTPKYPNVLAHPGPQDRSLITIAGPCSIESEDQIETICKELARVGVTYMRGGVFRAGTYPRDDFGFKDGLFEAWARIAKFHRLKIIVEVLDYRDIPYIDSLADAFQVGARHMQDYTLLHELSKLDKPVTLKRAPGATLDEFLGAAEYLCRGRCKPILIERGSSTHMNHVRWELSVSMIAAIKKMTGLPIIVDASHSGGRRDLVEPLTLAGIAAGADGFLVEVHPTPEQSLSDADQALPLSDFEWLLENAKAVREIARYI